MSALEGGEAEKGEPEKPKECDCKLKLGICSPFIGVNPSSTEEDPLFQELKLHLTEKLKMAMKEFDSFPHGVIAMPPDHEPYIARKKDPYQDSSPELDKKPDESDLAGFYAEDTVYGTVLAELKKLADSSDEQAFIMKGYMSSTFIKHLPALNLHNIEVDTLIVLPSRKLLIVIETKAATEDKSFPSKLKKGSQQCETFHQYLKAAHWNILSEQWKLVKCVSLPLIVNLEEEKNQEKIGQNCGCCQNCMKFIIDESKLENMEAWLKNVLDRFPLKHDMNHEYTNLITRILGFTMIMKNPSPWSLTPSENRKLNDYAITGSESGLSSEPPESWIWLRKGQLEALSCLRVIFYADYGTGKTLLLKRKALELSEKAANQEIGEFGRKVLFISLAAAADIYQYATEIKFREYWRNETILDLCNKLDFKKQVKKKTMKVCGVSDLVEEYEKSGNRATEGLTWTELVSFILCKEEYKDHHVFIDEIPYNEPGVDKIAESADSGKNGKNSDRHVWMAIGTGTVLGSIYENTFPEWQKRMEDEPYSFVFPKLSENLRNSKNVIEFTKKHRSRWDHLVELRKKADGPKHHPVIGPQPEYIRVNIDNLHDILDILRTTLEKNYPDKEEPVVILCNNVSSVFADIKGKMMSGDPENQRNVIQYSIESMTSDQRLEQRETLLKYLQQPEGVLVTDILTFAGMQARNIIVFEPDTLLSPRRNMLLRATTSLVYIKGATPIPLSS